MGMPYAVVDMVGDDAEYDILIDTVAEASARFEEQQRAIVEVRHLCESRKGEHVQSELVLEVLKRHGA